MKELEERVARDQTNARRAQAAARRNVESFDGATGRPDWTGSLTRHHAQRRLHKAAELASFRAVASSPFHAMVEVLVSTDHHSNRRQLWYANKDAQYNTVLDDDDIQITVLSWTHPGIQLSLSGQLGADHQVGEQEYTLRSVRPMARAKYAKVLPNIEGLYEPGGMVHRERVVEPSHGLKSVKLDMTADQVRAFISKMQGLLVVTGAPGSGKTTVALQRVRFLFDQQSELRIDKTGIAYAPELTQIFLANENLIEHTKDLLVSELGIPTDVVAFVPEYISRYLEMVWRHRLDARPRTRRVDQLEFNARRAFYGLCTTSELLGCWQVYEAQVANRLSDHFPVQELLTRFFVKGNKDALVELRDALRRVAGSDRANNPLKSRLRMDSLFTGVKPAYERLRGLLSDDQRGRFDEEFAKWLYFVYDPMQSVATYFGEHLYEGGIRIQRGTGHHAREEEVITAIRNDWGSRQYGIEERPLLAWLLRFALPEVPLARDRFKDIPCALPAMDGAPESRHTHIVIDEAQDLSAAEASFLGSLVDPDGALTVAADFRQVVSPVRGTTDISALKSCLSLKDSVADQLYPFARNMRQSQPITQFLLAFYERAFGERPTFEAHGHPMDEKPHLVIDNAAQFALRVRQFWRVLSRSDEISTIALLQINEDEEAMIRLRKALVEMRVPLGETWQPYATKKALITTSTERVKGLEYDACIVLGLEDVERSTLNFTVNRAYVALSRPSQRLIMLCEEFPRLLQNISPHLFER